METNEKISNFKTKLKNTFTKEGLKKAGNTIYSKGSVYIIFLVLIIVFECFNPRFLSGQNIYNILSGSTFYIIAGMGIMFVMLTGGIDLSVSWQVSIVQVVAAILMLEKGMSLWLIWPICLVLGFACGLLNGVLAAKLKLFPLIITLATSEVFKGVAYNITQGKTYAGMLSTFRGLYTIKFLGLPLDVYLAIIFVFITWFVLNKTHFGRNILAVGGSKETSRLSGINVAFITAMAYAICGSVFAVAGLDMLAQENLAQASNSGIEFTCLTAAIIGGISMMGGKGNVMGMVIGIFIMQIISNGMQLAGFGPYTQYIVKGFILLAAVTFDVIKNMPKIRLKFHHEDKKPILMSEGNGPAFPPNGFKFSGGKPDISKLPPLVDVTYVKRKYLDLKYKGLSSSEVMDIFLPDEGSGPFPVLIHIHGGGFAMGNKRDGHVKKLLESINKGYAFISIEYRLSGEAIFPAAVLDVREAIRFIKAHADEYHLDPERIATIGGSAGGNLSAMLAMNIPNGNFIGEENQSFEFNPSIKCAIDWFGPTDFSLMDKEALENKISFTDHNCDYSAESCYLGKKLDLVDSSLIQKANPMSYISKNMSPLLIEHGTVDKLVPFAQSEIFFQKIQKELGDGHAEFHPLIGADHEDKMFESDENMDIVYDFLRRKL